MLEDVGSFDETFFMYYEDTDLNWRMRLRGWKVMYEPTAVVDHVHAGSSREWSPFFIFCVDRNRMFMLLKNAALPMVARSYRRFATLAFDNSRLVARGRMSERRSASGNFSHERAGRDSSRARIHLHVAASLAAHLPEMLAKRAHIRRRRTVPDAAIERWFYPREQWVAR